MTENHIVIRSGVEYKSRVSDLFAGLTILKRELEHSIPPEVGENFDKWFELYDDALNDFYKFQKKLLLDVEEENKNKDKKTVLK
jgi:hypothetical protein